MIVPGSHTIRSDRKGKGRRKRSSGFMQEFE